jgi:hypothetical protein
MICPNCNEECFALHKHEKLDREMCSLCTLFHLVILENGEVRKKLEKCLRFIEHLDALDTELCSIQESMTLNPIQAKAHNLLVELGEI